MMNFVDLNGYSLLKKYDPEIKGTPFINDNWELAKITLSEGKEISHLPIKLNIESNELYFLDSTGKEMIAIKGLVKKIDYLNYWSKDSIKYVFKSGYPNIDKQTENYYYQVLTEGKIELLAKKFKYITVDKNELSGEISKNFVESAIKLYVYANNIIQAFYPNKDFGISLLKDKEKLINMFVDTNKIKFKKTKDLIKLFNYYNVLEKQ